MKLPSIDLIFINPHKASKPRHITLHFSVIFSIICLCIICIAGLGRLGYFASTYTIAKLGFYEECLKNERLQVKVKVIDKIISGESKKIENLIAFEDNTRLAFGMEPISDDVRKAGIGGNPIPEDYRMNDYIDPAFNQAEKIRQKLSELLRRTHLQITTFEQVTGIVKQQQDYWNQRPSIWPAAGKLTSGFGVRLDPLLGGEIFHDGIDIANEIGTPVYASADGIIKEAGSIQDYGHTVIINHPNSEVESLYAHLLRSVVTKYTSVKRGDLIGYVGNTGRSTGPHVHYEIRLKGTAINPVSYILPSDHIVD